MSCFRDQLHGLVSKRVRLSRGGPDVCKGTLVGISEDFLTVYADSGSLVHYPLHHLKSLTELMTETANTDTPELPQECEGVPSTFRGLMESYKGKKIQVYDHGPESAIGFVFEVGNDYAKIVTSPDEMVHFPYFHIRSVRLWSPKAKEEKKDDKGKEDKGKEDKGKEDKGKEAEGKGKAGSKESAEHEGRAAVKAVDAPTAAAGTMAEAAPVKDTTEPQHYPTRSVYFPQEENGRQKSRARSRRS